MRSGRSPLRLAWRNNPSSVSPRNCTSTTSCGRTHSGVAPRSCARVGGFSSDTPLAQMYAGARTLRIADGPDEVHVRTVARSVLKPYRHHP